MRNIGHSLPLLITATPVAARSVTASLCLALTISAGLPTPAQSNQTVSKSAPASGTHHTNSPTSDLISRPVFDPQATQRLVTFWQKRVQAEPTGAIALRELAGAYLARARENGDISYVVKAEQAARKSLQVLPERNNFTAQLRLARSLLTQHRFPEALAIADRAAVQNGEAHRLRADIALELGNDSLAESALAAIPALPDDPKRQNDLNYKALRARLLEGKGQWREGLALRREAARQAEQFVDMPAETAAWYHTMVGHTLIDRGQLEAGERACRRALEIFPLDYRAMTGLAEAQMWRKNWKEVIAWSQKSYRIAPQNPEILILLGDAYAALGKPQESQRQYQLLAQLARSFPRIYDRNWILFCADHKRDLNSALALARRDLKLRQDAGAYDALAWVCYKAGLLSEARAVMKKALAMGADDASTLYHAGMIAFASGDRTDARSLFKRARAFNPYFAKHNDMPLL
jgi:tetratricopeptide (TPR) repeat protein